MEESCYMTRLPSKVRPPPGFVQQQQRSVNGFSPVVQSSDKAADQVPVYTRVAGVHPTHLYNGGRPFSNQMYVPPPPQTEHVLYPVNSSSNPESIVHLRSTPSRHSNGSNSTRRHGMYIQGSCPSVPTRSHRASMHDQPPGGGSTESQKKRHSTQAVYLNAQVSVRGEQSPGHRNGAEQQPVVPLKPKYDPVVVQQQPPPPPKPKYEPVPPQPKPKTDPPKPKQSESTPSHKPPLPPSHLDVPPRPPPRTRPKSWTSSLFNAMRTNHRTVTFQRVDEEQTVAQKQTYIEKDNTAAMESQQKFYSLPRSGLQQKPTKARSRTPSPFGTLLKGIVKGTAAIIANCVHFFRLLTSTLTFYHFLQVWYTKTHELAAMVRAKKVRELQRRMWSVLPTELKGLLPAWSCDRSPESSPIRKKSTNACRCPRI